MAANDVPCCEPMFWVYLIICVVLVCFAGLMSGLTLGLMSLSLVDLEVLIKAGQPQDRKNAEKILPLVKNQHLLLCTLLIGNALAMEALPIFIDALLPAWGAILISVTLILAFGEIIPQAVCSRYGLSVGAKMSVVVRLVVMVLFPLAYPISKLLDWILGEKHSALLRRAELKTLVDMHRKEAGKGGELTQDETTIITGALDMTQKTAKDAMTPLSKVFSLDINAKLDEKTMERILSTGHSRIPIYSGNPANIIGLILCNNDVNGSAEEIKSESSMFKTNSNSNSKQRKPDTEGIAHQPGHNEKLNICVCSPPVYSSMDTEIQSPIPYTVGDVRARLPTKFKKSEYQKQILSNEDLESLAASDEEVIGIITLEDVMEELLQEEILDETDEYVDIHNKIKINMLASGRSPLIRSPIVASASHIQWRSPLASPASSHHQTPLSSCNHTPTLHSPIPPYIRSPMIRPALSFSPGRSVPNSSAETAHYSSSPHRVSRKSYAKLREAQQL
ncbi:hypothetical protein JCGZ_26048 [Jatropha curcas]|uniref:CNNM transmembrane domain-containing protein n=1 Tax=Jatropha curcas TaxID=180498 RepID=A0A067JEJ5_JATCU|nr:hypothetical protein JCGZ_26048 [Jatropha curcas]